MPYSQTLGLGLNYIYHQLSLSSNFHTTVCVASQPLYHMSQSHNKSPNISKQIQLVLFLWRTLTNTLEARLPSYLVVKQVED
jgi:hypothetical protein